MPNAYVSLTAFKSTADLNITGTAYDNRLLILLENVSRQIDKYCNRVFYPWVGTIRWSGDGSTLTILPQDTISITALDEDTNEDGTFETNWAGTGTGGTDFLLEPLDAAPTGTIDHRVKPYTRMRVNPMSNGTQDVFIKQNNNYRQAGTFGYSFVTRDGGATASASLGGSATTTFVIAGGTALEPGQLIYVDSELMYIRSVTTGTSYTVDRGVNGFTVATHTLGASVTVVQFIGPIQMATEIQAARIWKRQESAFTSLVGLDQTGAVAVFQGGLDGDVKAMLQPYRKFTI